MAGLDGLQRDVVAPAVTEVVLVVELIARVREQASKRDLALVLDVEFRRGVPIAVGAALEHVQVGVLPADGRRQNLVETVQTDVGGHVQPAPDRRVVGLLQRDPDAQDGACGTPEAEPRAHAARAQLRQSDHLVGNAQDAEVGDGIEHPEQVTVASLALPADLLLARVRKRVARHRGIPRAPGRQAPAPPDQLREDRLGGARRIGHDHRAAELVSESRERLEHPHDQLERPGEQFGVLAHRDEAATYDSNEASGLGPRDHEAEPGQVRAAADREPRVKHVAGVQQVHERKRVREPDPAGLRERPARTDPVHERAHPPHCGGGRRRRRESIGRHRGRKIPPFDELGLRSTGSRRWPVDPDRLSIFGVLDEGRDVAGTAIIEPTTSTEVPARAKDAVGGDQLDQLDGHWGRVGR